MKTQVCPIYFTVLCGRPELHRAGSDGRRGARKALDSRSLLHVSSVFLVATTAENKQQEAVPEGRRNIRTIPYWARPPLWSHPGNIQTLIYTSHNQDKNKTKNFYFSYHLCHNKTPETWIIKMPTLWMDRGVDPKNTRAKNTKHKNVNICH